ncbi:MAG: hypothetical protein E7254_00250 [Lachnospiraceae bacterium]|nr:hypothetical protein [Lachnospiraceae bacterium]
MWGKRAFSLLIALSMCAGLTLNIATVPKTQVEAANSICDTYSGMNINGQNYDRWSSTVKSYLVPQSDGKLMRVQYGDKISGGVLVEYYDSSYNFKSKKIIPMELPVFGGFFETPSFYFLLTGQNNPNQSDDVKVYAITRYDKNWNKLGTDSLKGANTTYPFDAGSARFALCNNLLYVRTCHEMYNGHQACVSIVYNIATDKIVDSYTAVMNSEYGYVSHSFNQFAAIDNDRFICVDHGDAYPRSIVLTKYNVSASSGKVTLDYYEKCTTKDIMAFPGNTGDNTTGATVGAFQVTGNTFLIAGNSVKQDSSNTSHKTRNIFVASVDKSTLAVTTKWITSYAEGETTTRTPHMVKIGSDRYALIWSRDGDVFYTVVNSKGNIQSEIKSFSGELSDCAPVVYNDKIVWYTWRNNVNKFYEISVSNMDSTNVIEIENGHHYINNGINNGYANLHCTVCGHDEQMAVATSQSVWWKENDNSGYYYSTVNSAKNIGDQVRCWVTLNPDSGVNTDITIEPSDKSAMRIEYTSDNMATITMLKAGTYYLYIYPTYNESLKKQQKFVVTGPGIELNGFQISYLAKGLRTIYSIDSSIGGKSVKSSGLIYSILNVDDSLITYNSSNANVKYFNSTSKGLLSTNYSEIGTQKSYAMTMVFGNVVPAFYTEKMKIRAYAVLSDNTVKYSDIYEVNVYGIADTLYKKKMMSTEAGHNYLYSDILKKVNSSYTAIRYTEGNYGLIK